MRNRNPLLVALVLVLALCAPMLSGCELFATGGRQNDQAEESAPEQVAEVTEQSAGEQTLDHSSGPAAVAYDFVYTYCNSIEFSDPADDSQFQPVANWRDAVLAYVAPDTDLYYDLPGNPPRQSATVSCEVTSVDGNTVICKVVLYTVGSETPKGWTEDAPREEFWYRVMVGDDGLVQSFNVSQG